MSRTFLLLFALAWAQFSFAQRGGNSDGARLSWEGAGTGNGIPTIFGASAGVSSGSFSNQTGSARTGFALSAFIAVPVSASFFIRPEFGYAQAGARDNNYQFDADYFQLPLLACFRLSANNLYLMAGPQLSMLMSASQMNAGVKADARDGMQVTSFSLAGGVEWVPRHVGLYVRGQWGFGNASLSASPPQHLYILSAGIAVHL